MLVGKMNVCGRWALRFVLGALAVGVFVGGLGISAEARPVSKKIKFACNSDYSRFCGSYKIGSSKLRKCMKSHGRRLSDRCLRALVDAGQVSRKVLRARKRKSSRR